MIDSRTKLTVLHDAAGVFTDYTKFAADYIRDPFTVTIAAATGYLYLGFTKPFGAAYVELPTPSTTSATFAAEYYDGAAWTALTIDDESKAFQRSGYIFWDKTLMSSVSINSNTKYYIRLRPSASTSATIVRGINLVFSDDVQLKQEFFDIDNTNILPPGEDSHISAHVASRNFILQSLRNQGYIKSAESATGSISDENITQWDLHDLFEIRQAATYLALSKIFFNLSDAVDDHWWQKYQDYQDKYEGAMRLARLSLDKDDSGVEEVDENVQNAQPTRWNR